jgi:hypothetical protein
MVPNPEKCPKCSQMIIGMEDPMVYDGICEWQCAGASLINSTPLSKSCDYRVGRFCGKELRKGEREYAWCEGEDHKQSKHE